MFASNNNDEYSDVKIDFLSNGFKLRANDGAVNNPSYSPYIYYAVAETPFKYSNAK